MDEKVRRCRKDKERELKIKYRSKKVNNDKNDAK